MIADTEIDRELAALESRRSQLQATKHQRRSELQGRLMSLEQRLAPLLGRLDRLAAAAKEGIPDVNATPEIRQLAEAWWRAEDSARDFGRKIVFGGLGDRTKPDYYERIDRERERLRAEADAAHRRYCNAFEAKHRELWEAHQAATAEEKKHVESEIAELRQQIDTIEDELRKTTP